MLTNRISAYWCDTEEPASMTMTGMFPFENAPPTKNGPPENFAPVPPQLLSQFPPQLPAWQAELYRRAYQAALARVAAAAKAANLARARWN